MTDSRAPDDLSVARPGPTPALIPYTRKLAHDLNNYATVVRTYSELLLADLPPGATRDDVTEIHRAADALVAYLQRVTRFARASTMRPMPQPLLALVQGVVDDSALAPGGAPVLLEAATEAVASVQVSVDSIWFRDVLRELITNAREASPALSPVVVRVALHADGRQVQVEVRDQGPGFAASVADSAELPLVTTKDGVRGAGMGLTLAAAFAEGSGATLHRGRMGDITCVALWMPIADAATA